MQTSQLTEIYTAYDLGQPLSVPKSVTGGLLHKIWRLQTTKGNFALKVLNPEIMRRKDVFKNYVKSEDIAKKASDAGISAVVALHTKDGPVFKSNAEFIIIYPWIEGNPITDKQITLEQAEIIGSLLAEIHQLNLVVGNHEVPQENKTTKDHWINLFTQVKNEGLTLDESAINSIVDLVVKIEEVKQRLHELDINRVISHCDFDKKNVLWSDVTHPVIIDWESAGSVNPEVELMITAQDWSDLASERGDLALFKTVVNGYKKSGGVLLSSPEVVFYGSIVTVLDWLEYNIRRSYEDQFEEEERQLGKSEVIRTIKELKRLNQRKEEIINSFR